MNGAPATNARDMGDRSNTKSAPSRNEPNLSSGFMNPSDVADDPVLTLEEKRATLAAWASDLRAVPDAPGLRQLDNGAVVRIDDVLQALTSLDEAVDPAATLSAGSRVTIGRRPRLATRLKFAWRRNRSDDDDDPPPCPAIAMRPPRGPLMGGGRAIPDAALAA